MKNPLRKLKTSFQNIQWNTRRKRFIGLEVILFTFFMFGYSVIDALFLTDYQTVKEVLDPLPYVAYTLSMLSIVGIFMAMFFFAGMYFQGFLTEKAAKKLIKTLGENKDNPRAMLNEILNGNIGN